MLELQAEEEEHMQELNGQKDGGTYRPDERRNRRDSTAGKKLESGGGIQSSYLRSTAKDLEGAAVIHDNRSAVLDSLREKLTEAENFNRQLEHRLSRAEEILETARSLSQPISSANTTDTAPASSSSAPENTVHAPLRAVAPTTAMGPAQPLPDPLSVSGKAWTWPQLAEPATQVRWSLPGHHLEREKVELRPPPPLQDSEWQRRKDDQVLANRLAALVPLEEASTSHPRIPADAQARAPYLSASLPVSFERYNYPQRRWASSSWTSRAEPPAHWSPPPLDRRGGDDAARARRDPAADEWSQHPSQSGLATRRSTGRRNERRGRGSDLELSDGYEEEDQQRQERRERNRNRESRRAPNRREDESSRRESSGRVPERRSAVERRSPEGRRRGDGERRRGNDVETDAGEVERLLASVGLSGYEAVLLRNGWDCMARLRLIKEADLVSIADALTASARPSTDTAGRMYTLLQHCPHQPGPYHGIRTIFWIGFGELMRVRAVAGGNGRQARSRARHGRVHRSGPLGCLGAARPLRARACPDPSALTKPAVGPPIRPRFAGPSAPHSSRADRLPHTAQMSIGSLLRLHRPAGFPSVIKVSNQVKSEEYYCKRCACSLFSCGAIVFGVERGL